MKLTKVQEILIVKISRKFHEDSLINSFDIESLEQTIGTKVPQALTEILPLYYDVGENMYLETEAILYDEDEDRFSSFWAPVSWENWYLWYIEELNEFIDIDMHDYLVIGSTGTNASIAIGLRYEIVGQIFWMDFREVDDFKYFKIADSLLEFIEML